MFAEKYYKEGADEIIYQDVVASLYGKNTLTEIVNRTASNLFIPLTVGGGIRSLEDIKKLLNAGADKFQLIVLQLKIQILSKKLQKHLEVQQYLFPWRLIKLIMNI